jgi:hypothetical protein
MNKRLGTLIAALSLAAVAEINGATIPVREPRPNPGPNPAPCFNWRRECRPAPPCPTAQQCAPRPRPAPCGGAGQVPCR